MQYSGVAFSFMLDVFLFNQVFTGLEVLGVCICLFFSFVTAIYKHWWATPAKKPVASEEENLLVTNKSSIHEKQ